MNVEQKPGMRLWPVLALLTALAVAAPASATPAGCTYPAPAEGSGMGGTGVVAEGSGMGGTGAPAAAASAQPTRAGSVIFSQGAAEAQGAGGTRPLAKGAPVCVGETIVTSPSAKLQIRMADGGMLSIRPDTKVRIDEFHFDGKEDGSEKSVLMLLQGGFRALTGLIGHTHKANYAIRTPFANIGIRGTDHEPMFIPNPAPGQTPEGIPGTYDKVNSGGVVIRNANGAVDVKPDQIGFAPNDPAVSPSLLQEMPEFYRPAAGTDRGEHAGERGEGGSSGRDGGREHRERFREGDRIRAPEPHSDELRSPDVKVPEIQHPEASEAPESDD